MSGGLVTIRRVNTRDDTLGSVVSMYGRLVGVPLNVGLAANANYGDKVGNCCSRCLRGLVPSPPLPSFLFANPTSPIQLI